MNAFSEFREQAGLWQRAQQVFWEGAMRDPGMQDPMASVPPEWRMFDDLVDHLLAGFEPERTDPQPEWLTLLRAGNTYRRLVSDTWTEIREAFHAHCIAIHDPGGGMPDWRAYRDRWLATAEQGFIRLQRRPEFLAAQRDVLVAYCGWFLRQPPEVQKIVHAGRQAQRQAQEAALGLIPVEIAQTPKSSVWRQGNTTLSRYHPLRSGGPVLGPLLICYGLVGRQTMTDLLPQRSLVRNLLALGVDVFVIDWGSTGPEDAGNDLENYAVDLLGACIGAACEAAGCGAISVMGICQGGTLALTHAAVGNPSINGLVCTGTPVDFHADARDSNPAHGLLNLWIRSLSDAEIRDLIRAEQGLKGDFLGAIFNQLNPVRTLSRYLVGLPDAGRDPGDLTAFMAMETWLADRPDLPAAFASTWLVDLYRGNALVRGNLRLNGRAVDLADINVPVLNVIAAADHIIPPPCSAALSGFLPAERYRELLLPAGHIGAFVSRQAQTLTAPGIVEWLRNLPREA